MNKHLGTGSFSILAGAAMVGMCLHMIQHDQNTNWGVWDLIGMGIGFLDVLMGVVLIALSEEIK